MTKKSNKKKQRRNICIVFEELCDEQFRWTVPEIQAVIDGWNEGLGICDISYITGRDEGEASLLIMSIQNEWDQIILERSRGLLTSEPIKLKRNYKGHLNKFLNSIKESGGVYTAFENVSVDYFWDEDELMLLRLYNLQKKPIEDIAKHFRKSVLSTALAIIDRCDRRGFGYYMNEVI